jgi:hypothetical protein
MNKNGVRVFMADALAKAGKLGATKVKTYAIYARLEAEQNKIRRISQEMKQDRINYLRTKV